jgi:hypothetical protein
VVASANLASSIWGLPLNSTNKESLTHKGHYRIQFISQGSIRT